MRKGLRIVAAALTAGALFMSSDLQAQANSAPFWSTEGNNNVDNLSKLGTTNAIPLRFFTNDEVRAFIAIDGKFGVGTSTPSQRFHVEGTLNQAIFVSTTVPGENSGSGMIGSVKALPTGEGNRLGYFLAGSRGGAQNGYNAVGMVGYSSGAWTAGSSHPAYLTFETTPFGSASRVERVRIGSGGNVGIGTADPDRLLHVFKGSAGVVTAHANAPLVVENSTNSYVNVLAPNGNETGILFGKPASNVSGGIIYSNNNAVNGLQFRTNGNVTRMTLSDLGNLDITGGTLSFGSLETLADAGAFTISSNSNLVPSETSTSLSTGHTLGNSSFKWREVWAFDGTINTSDERDKANVRELEYGMKEIMQLRSTRFNWKGDQGKGEKLGLIAQELKKVLPEVVRDWEYKQTTEDGPMEKVATERMGVMYADIIPVLIKGMQEQQQMIEQQQQQINDLKAIVDKMANGGSLSSSLSSASIGMVTPNPVKGSASIRYSVPDGSTAQLLVSDAAGRQVKSISLKGSGTLNLDASSLASGVYQYSLLVNGRKVQTEKMTVLR